MFVLVDLIKTANNVLGWLIYNYIVYLVFLIYTGLLHGSCAESNNQKIV